MKELRYYVNGEKHFVQVNEVMFSNRMRDICIECGQNREFSSIIKEALIYAVDGNLPPNFTIGSCLTLI